MTVRKIEENEFDRAIMVCEQAFSWDARPEDLEAVKQVLPADRVFVAVDEDDLVGTGGNYTFEMSVPGGGRVPTAGLTMVGVLPTHRRRGALRMLMKAFLEDARDRGEPLSALWASESLIYQRFGFGMASKHLQIEAERARMTFLSDTGAVGKTRFLTEDEAIKVLPSVYDRAMNHIPGMVSRDETWWRHHRLRDPEHERQGDSPMWRVVLEIDGSPEAYVLYRVHGDWPDGNPRGKVRVLEAMSVDPVSTRELWRFIFGIDLIESVQSHFLPIDHPLQHMLADPRRMSKKFSDNLWLRVVDIPEALKARSYSTSDAVTFGVEDDLLSGNTGTWRLDTTGDSVSVTQVDDAPEVTMHMRELGAAYLGGTRFSELQNAGRVHEQKAGSVRRLDLLFAADRAPWCPEIF